MKAVDCGRALAAVLVLAVWAAGQTVWNGELDTAWYTANKTQERFTITTAEQLAGLAYLVKGTGGSGGKGGGSGGYTMSGKTFTLGGDIALNVLNDPEEYKRWGENPPANRWKAIGDSVSPFQGAFDGDVFFVRGVYIDTASGYQGLFGYVNKGGSIKRLRVSESYIRGGGYVGALVGSDSGTITDCYAKAMIVSDGGYAGGLVGLSKGTIANSYASGDVFGGSYVGGLAGFAAKDTIRESYATGSVTGSGGYVGGLVGLDSGSAIINSYASGEVRGGNCAGGLAGKSYSTVYNSFAAGDVSGGDTVGGLIGAKAKGEIKNCYAAGAAAGNSAVGGLTGTLNRAAPDPAAVIYGYYNIDAAGADGTAGIPKTAEYMQSEEFAGLLNTAAYALSANKWFFSPYKYPTLGGGRVPESHFLGCFAGGDGGSDVNPFMIETERQLANLAILVNCGMGMDGKYFRLGRNINLTEEWIPIGKYGPPFKGSFEGGGFSVGGLIINDTTDTGRDLGLFGRIGKEGAVRNLGIDAPRISGYCNLGALAGRNSGTITKCFAKGGDGWIKAVGGVKGAGGAGGLVGVDSAGTITSSYATVDIFGTINMAGGLAGWNYAGSRITYCYAMTGSIDVIGDDVGGLVGRNDASTISDCYAKSESGVSGYKEGSEIGGAAIGGLVGVNVDAVVAKCYSIGRVSGKSSVGGLVGFKLGSGRIDSSYYREDAVDVVNDYGISQTDNGMKQTDTYKGWRFNIDWALDDDGNALYSYPYLMSIGNPNAVSVLYSDRVIPEPPGGKALAAVSPPPPLTAEFAAGPNPAVRPGGAVSFFRKGKRIAECELLIYDALGSVVNKVKISDRASAPHSRKVGSWNLTDAKGRRVPEGAYLVRGVAVCEDGKRERVSAVVGVK